VYPDPVQVTPRDDRRELERCPLCHAVTGADELTTCPSCGTSAHAACVRDLGDGRCPTQGCAARALTRPPQVKRRTHPLVAGLAIAFVVLFPVLAVWQVRATRALETLVERCDTYTRRSIEQADLDQGRALVAELRTSPRNLDFDGAMIDDLARRLEELVLAEEARREAMRHPPR
jgi:hypothetical protein